MTPRRIGRSRYTAPTSSVVHMRRSWLEFLLLLSFRTYFVVLGQLLLVVAVEVIVDNLGVVSVGVVSATFAVSGSVDLTPLVIAHL